VSRCNFLPHRRFSAPFFGCRGRQSSGSRSIRRSIQA
jgi:hypothetical protein